mmetsp:Transcript_7015/g.5257  ORF Transcript_7015/g.5257 Transcript_7015/m.5257 type:complete len:92 (-) Transcript_7015:1012-1287(-)
MWQIEGMPGQTSANLAEMFMHVHKSVETTSDKFFEELRRKVYVTPKTYLDGLNLFLTQLNLKRKESKENIQRLSNGILKLKATNDQIEGLK